MLNVFTVTLVVLVTVQPEPEELATTVYTPAIPVVRLLSVGVELVELNANGPLHA
jgi:hypothetical protein